MIGRVILGVLSAAAACASWAGRPHASVEASRPRESPPVASIYAGVLPGDNPFVPALDAAYRDLEDAMRPHGCTSCHARDPMHVLDTRRAIEAMVEANLMPPETAEHPAGIADQASRALLLHRARAFRAVGDAAVASW